MIRLAFFIYLLLSSLLNSLFTASIYAQGTESQSVNVSVNASVADYVEFTWDMHQLLGDEDPWGGEADQTAMSFENLVNSEDYPGEFPNLTPRLFSDIWYCIFLWTNVTKPYHIKQTSTSLYNRNTGNANDNLDNSFIVVPDYNANDKWDGLYPQGAIGGDALGAASLVKNANILYYGNDGVSHILRLYYSIPAQPKVAISGWQYIPTSQFAGNYQGTVTITITPQS